MKTRTSPYLLPRRVLMMLSAMLLALMLLYTYFVTLSVFHAVAREDALIQADALSDTVAVLEKTYLERSQALTEVYAHSLGFVPAHQKSFVARDAVAVSTALQNAR